MVVFDSENIEPLKLSGAFVSCNILRLPVAYYSALDRLRLHKSSLGIVSDPGRHLKKSNDKDASVNTH